MNDQQQQRDRTNTVYYDAQSNFGTPPIEGGGDFKNSKIGSRKGSQSSEKKEESHYERVHTERRHHTHSTGSSSPFPHRPPSRDRNPHQPTVIHHPIRSSPSSGPPTVIMAPMSTSYDYSIGSTASPSAFRTEKSVGSRWQSTHEDFRPGPRASSAANIDALFAPKTPRSQSTSSGAPTTPSGRMTTGGGGYESANVVFSRRTAEPSTPIRNFQNPRDYGVVGAYSETYGRTSRGSVRKHSNDYELDPRLNVSYPQFYVDDWNERHPNQRNRGNSVHPLPTRFPTESMRHVYEEVPMGGPNGGGYRSPSGYGSKNLRETAILDDYDNVPNEFLDENLQRNRKTDEISNKDGESGIYQPGRYQPYPMLSTITSTSSLIQLSTSNSTASPLTLRRKASEITTPTETLYRKWSNIATPPRNGSTVDLEGEARRGVLKATLSMSAKDRARKFSERIASWVSMSISENASSSDDEDDPEYLELMERDSIINRYEKGPDAADVDPWENPDFEVYTNLDRFGFVHKKGEKCGGENSDSHKRRIVKELSREKKWLKMIEIWKSGGPSKKMEDRIWKGIPEKLRIVIWPRLLGAERLKHEKRDVYAELLLRARLVSKDIKQIDLDINRTYRDHLAFRKRYDVKQKSLLNVLAAYSMYNTEVGYCQGMSQIVALFLMYVDEEDAFWCLHQLMVSPKHTMHGFFVPGFPKLQRFEEHFKRVLKKYKPRVYKYLEKQDIPYIYLTKWWFGCFLDRVPFSLALRLWDVFLIEGDPILIAMAFNIMKMHEKSIRKHSMETFMEFIQNEIAQNFGYSDDEVMHSLRETLTKLKSDRQHVPPPARPEDLSEVPTKALGPILQKPMASIREEIHEIQSRRSRANSTGRSPHPKRKESRGASKGPPPVTHKWNGNASQDSILHGNGRDVPFEIPSRRIPGSSAPSESLPPAGSQKSTANRNPQNSHSNSSRGGTPSAQRLRDERNGQMVLLSRASDSEPDVSSPSNHLRESSWNSSSQQHVSTATSRITHSGNNITRIELDGDVSVI